MPWKYLRITRRCTCVTPDLAGRGKMNHCSGSGEEPLLFLHKSAAAVTGSGCDYDSVSKSCTSECLPKYAPM